ncbi:MAG: CpaF family protein [Candidatus Omnitrophica bacterium]|nr:CpaF family protein [Candidatus Omnitrophota bacterium]
MRLVDALDRLPEGNRRAMNRDELAATLRQLIASSPEELRQLNGAGAGEADRLVHEVIEEMLGFGPLDRFLNDPTITEIMINGPGEMFVERDGRLERVESIFRDAAHLMAVIERLLGSVGLAVNESEPLCDASLPNGSRVNVIIPPLVLNGPVVTIRTKSRTWTMDDYIKAGALSPDAAAFLRACVRAKVNLVVSGGTSTGKTTLVSIFSNDIPPEERIITIENVAEMELRGRDHWIRLVAKSPNLEGRGEIPLRTLVKNALRMRPDRLILGEARGGEALDVVQAMHSGHDGVMTVLHANTPSAALERLETLMLMSGLDLPPQACRVQIASAVDLVVHLGRYADGSRRIAAIAQVLGTSQEGFALEELFLFEPQGFTPEGRLRGSCRYTGAKPKFLSKFHLANVEIPSWVTT